MRTFRTPERNLCDALAGAFFGLIACASGQSIIINEINPDPLDKMRPTEFIELYNPGAADADIGGWVLEDGVEFLFPAGTVIPAGGYRVIAANPTAFQADYGFAPLGPWTGKLSNEGERIRLRASSGVVIDEVNYGAGFPWPTAAFGAGSSMELIHPSLDNDLGGSWRSAVAAPTPPPFVPASTTGWRYKLGTAEASSPVDAWRQWNYDDSTGWTTATLPIGYGEAVTTPIGTTKTAYLRKTFTLTAGQIANTIALRLRCDDGCIAFINGTEIQPRLRVNAGAVPPFNAADGVAANAPEPIVWEPEIIISNASSILREGTNVLAIQLINTTSGSSDLYLDAELKYPTGTAASPGAANTVFSTTAPPQIRQVEHSPQQPTAGQDVRVTAKITDPDGVGTVTLAYQPVNPGAYIRKSDAAYATTWTNIAMRDDGLGGDVLASDGIFSAIIPAAENTHRRLMRYRITAGDIPGTAITVPYPDDETPNFAYFVYNGVPGWSGAMRPAAFGGFPATPVQSFPSTLLDSIPPYHLLANATDVSNSQYVNTFNDVEFLGTMVYDGVVYDHIQFKNRGIGSTYVAGKNKWAFLFNRARDFEPRDNWGRKYAATWNSFGLDANASPWAAVHRGSAGVEEALSYRIYELAGIPSLRTHYVHLRVIDGAAESGPTQYDGDLWGLYLALEPTEGNFIDERGLASGNIYAIEGNGGDKKYQGDPPQPANASDWNAFRDAVAMAGQTESFYRTNEDLPALYTFLGLNRLIGNVDVRPGDNYRYYHRPTDNRWVVMPYDLDMQFIAAHHWGGAMDGITVAGSPNTIRAIMRHPALAIEYRNRCRELLSLMGSDASPNGGQIGQLVDEYAQLVHPTGQTLTWANLDAAMWNLHPRTAGGGANTGQSSHRGNFFRALYNDGTRGGLAGTVQTATWIRQLADPDGDGFSNHEGVMQWFVNYATNTYPAGAPTWLRKAVTTGAGNDPSVDRQKGFGYKYLEWESLYGGFANATAEPSVGPDLSFPNKPTISYAGPAGFPANDLSFESSAFSPSAIGGTTFAAMQWRIGEISAPGLPEYDPAQPRIYEIEEVWTSPEITNFSATIRVPVVAARPGHTYRARVRHKDANGRWSLWSDPVQFVPSAPSVSVYQQSIVITEVNYLPAQPSAGEVGFVASDFEWIEIKNVGEQPVDFTGLRFTKGVDFDFPDGYTIPAGGFALLVKNIAAFQKRWGHSYDAIIAGHFPDDNLNNAGDELKLSYGAGTPVIEFTYMPNSPWPVLSEPGRTLVLRNASLRPNPTTPSNWKASYAIGGTPGSDETINFESWATGFPGAEDPLGDPDTDGLKNLLEYALGSHPHAQTTGALPQNSMQSYTVDGATGDYLTLTVSRRGDDEDLQFVVEFAPALMGPWNTNGVLVSAVPGLNGNIVETWRAPVPFSASPQQFGRLRVVKP